MRTVAPRPPRQDLRDFELHGPWVVARRKPLRPHGYYILLAWHILEAVVVAVMLLFVLGVFAVIIWASPVIGSIAVICVIAKGIEPS